MPELVRAPRRVDPVELRREPAEQLRAQRRVSLTDRGERLLEQRDERLVDDAGLRQQADPEHRAGELLRALEPAGECRRALERRPSLPRLRGPPLSEAEVEQQLEAALGLAGAVELERLERPRVEVRRVLVREALGGAGRRPGRVVDGSLGVHRAPGLEVVVGDVPEPLVDLVRVQRLDRLADLAMDHGPARRRDLRVQCLADEGVGEGVAARPLARLRDQSRVGRRRERPADVFGRVATDPLDDLQVELAPAHGGQAQYLVRLLGQAVESTADDLAHALRDRHLAPRLVLAQAALGRHQPNHLADEERVAPGLVADRLGEVGRRPVDAGGELDEAGDPLRAETVEGDAARALDRPQVGERLGERMMAPELDVAVGADDQQSGVREAPGDEAQQQQRRLVGPVQVVEDEHQGA